MARKRKTKNDLDAFRLITAHDEKQQQKGQHSLCVLMSISWDKHQTKAIE